MTNTTPHGNRFTILQRSILLILSICLSGFLLVFRGELKANSSLENLARISLLPEEALSNGQPTIFEFYADWCEACKQMAPYMISVKEKTNDQVNIVLLNVDNPLWEELIDKYSVNGIPQMNFFDKQGNIKGQSIGVRSESQLMEIFRDLINENELPKFIGLERKTDFKIASYLDERYSYKNTVNSNPRSHS